MLPLHPLFLQKRLGISDTRFLLVSAELFVAAIFLIGAQASALIQLSVSFDLVDLLWWSRVVIPLAVLASGFLIWSFWRKRGNYRQSQKLEVELNPARHLDFVTRMDGLLSSLDYKTTITLRYLAFRNDANAFVTKREGCFFITVTRGLVALSRSTPQEAEAIVRHEISHIEADDVLFTTLTRNGAEIALVVIVAMNVLLVTVNLVLYFLSGDSNNFLPVAGTLLTSASAPIAGFFYYREYLLGREFLHDLRAVQLMKSPKPMRDYLTTLNEVHKRETVSERVVAQFRHFWAFHPTPRARLKNLVRLDPYGGWATITPILAGIFLALLPIQLAFGGHALELSAGSIRVLEWTLWSVTTLLLLRSDFSRLSVYLILRTRVALRVPVLIGLVLIGSFSAVLPYLLLSSVFKHHSLIPLISGIAYAANGVIWTAIGYGGAAILLAYIWGIYFLCKLRIWGWILNSLFQLYSVGTVVLFSLITLSRGETRFPLFLTLGLWFLVGCILAFLCVLGSECVHCPTRRWNAFLLKNRCSACANLTIQRSILED